MHDAYVAGIVDGEGSICLSKLKEKANRSGVTYRPYIAIYNTHLQTLQKIQKFIDQGGSLYKIKHSSKLNSNKQNYILKYSNKNAKFLLDKILPYLSMKKQQGELLLKYFELEASRANYSNYDEIIVSIHDIYVKIRELQSYVSFDKTPPTMREWITQPNTKCYVCGEIAHYHGMCKKHYRRSLKNQLEPRKCKTCEKDITELRADRLWCSHSCKMKWHRRHGCYAKKE